MYYSTASVAVTSSLVVATVVLCVGAFLSSTTVSLNCVCDFLSKSRVVRKMVRILWKDACGVSLVSACCTEGSDSKFDLASLRLLRASPSFASADDVSIPVFFNFTIRVSSRFEILSSRLMLARSRF
jgi:hypothetical protein